jgi:tetratricopeptide (TPR) repeat protein
VRALVSADVIAYQRGEPVHYSFGGEADLNGFLFARVGLLSAVRAAGPSAGLSAGLGISFYGFRLDYAYGSVGDLGRAQYASLSWSPRRRKTAVAGVSPGGEIPSSLPAKAEAAAPALPTVGDIYREGLTLYGERRYAEAAAKAEAVVAADPNYWEGWQLLGNCRFSMNDRAGALAAYGKSLELNPDNPSLKAFVDQLKSQ